MEAIVKILSNDGEAPSTKLTISRLEMNDRDALTPGGEGLDRVAEDAVGRSSAAPPDRRAIRQRGAGRLLDLREAEAYSGISAWTLRDLIASGDLPAVRPPRLRRVWIDRADLDKAIAQWKDRAG